MVRIGVIGAGINGLTSAIAIQERVPHADVTIIGKNLSPFTTGDASAGFWMPVSVGNHPQLNRWGELTYHYLLKLATSENAAEAGVQIIFGYILGSYEPIGNWPSYVDTYRQMTPAELSLYPHAKTGVSYMSISLDAPKYLSLLSRRFVNNGGTIIQKFVKNLTELSDYDIIVNCSGLGSRDLLPDPEMIPIRGQVLKIEAPWIKHFVLDYTSYPKDVAYVLIGGSYTTLGGTFQIGNADRHVSKQDTENIWSKCKRLMPSLTGAKILREVVGLRPYRKTIRLELEQKVLDNGQIKKIVHNYGHGGSGLTMFHGCSHDVAKIVSELPECKNSVTSKL